ncbi:MAG TPA: metallophosphoesterase [Aquihabitans sp.]|nr:metallophosphoesterase [Aquihabitans sp.]
MAVVVQLSDTHLRARVGPEDHALRRAVLAIRRALGVPPDAVALTGDLADDGSVAALERVAAAVAGFDAPIVALAGNHDLDESVERVFGPPGPLAADGWRIVPLATRVPGEVHGAVDVDAARAALADHAGHPTLLLAHHPPLGPSTHPWFTLRHGDGLLELLAERPDVRALGAGHLHQAFHVRRRALLVLGAPSTWYAIRHEGRRWAKAPSAPVGAVVWHLGSDGTARPALVPSLPR